MDKKPRQIMEAQPKEGRTRGRSRKTYGWHRGDGKTRWDGSDWIEEDCRQKKYLKSWVKVVPTL
jgi:hypothetical protein